MLFYANRGLEREPEVVNVSVTLGTREMNAIHVMMDIMMLEIPLALVSLLMFQF